MANITHGTTTRRSATRKLLLVRQPMRSVRRGDQPDPRPLRLAIGLLVAVGIVFTVWLIGHLGYRLGFAPLVRVPELTGSPGSGLATGTMVLISIPRAIFRAGLVQPLWLMLGFALIALPAAGLGAARPQTPGGPRPNHGIVIIAHLGAVVSMVCGAVLTWWTVSPQRAAMLRVLPTETSEVASWYADMQSVAGLDVLGVVCASLWVVLVFRLPITLWLRVMAATAALFTLVVVTVAMAISNAGATQIGAARSLCVLDQRPGDLRLILSSTPRHTATLVASNGRAYVELHDTTGSIVVNGEQSILDYLSERAAP